MNQPIECDYCQLDYQKCFKIKSCAMEYDVFIPIEYLNCRCVISPIVTWERIKPVNIFSNN